MLTTGIKGSLFGVEFMWNNQHLETNSSLCWSAPNTPRCNDVVFPFFFPPAAADLRIGEVQWGDSGVYICKVVIADDLEGQNEASVELLVLGKLSQHELDL